MSTLTLADAPDAPTRTTAPYERTFARALRSEWIKLATLRSTWWSIAITAALTVGISVLFALAMSGPADDGIAAVVTSIQFTMLLAGILGVISVTGEYSTGMIRSSLTAVPVRGVVLGAKAIVIAAVMFAASFLIFLIATFAVTPIVEARDHPILWGDPAESWLPLLAASFSMSVFALIGLSFGFMLRSGAGAIAATVGLLFVLPIVVSMFDVTTFGWIRDFGLYLPMFASQNLTFPQSDWGLEWPVALLALCGWVVAGLLGAWAVLRTRDA